MDRITSRADVLNYVSWLKRVECLEGGPNYWIYLFEHPNRDNGLGFPDFGRTKKLGFYITLSEPIFIVEHFCESIRENIYNALFILPKFPGSLTFVVPEGRMYFRWDEENHKYQHEEEPEIFNFIGF